jgi:DNA-binding LacI/PurR family transcriptional regulator
MAATAFSMLRADPTTAAGEPRHIELATTLVLRESTAPPQIPARA